MSGKTDLFEGPEGDGERAPSPFSGAPGGATEAARARIGRPAGARNKRDQAAERWYFAKGYIDPMQKLGELLSEDPRVLQAWFTEHAGFYADGRPKPGPDILDVVRMQIAAAGELMPYLHGKKPISVEVEGQLLPILAILTGDDQLAQAARLEEAQRLSIGRPIVEGEAKEINGLEGGE